MQVLPFPAIGHMKPIDPAAVDRLKRLLLELNLNQVEFASRVGMDVSTINKYLSGKLPLSDKFLFRVLNVFAINPDYIKNGKGEKRVVRTPTGNTNTNTNTITQNVGTGQVGSDELARLKEELHQEKIKALEEQNRLLQEIIRLQREGK